MTSCPHFDLLNPATYVDGVPFEQLKELRNACPVSKQRDTDNDMDYWAITRREDIDFISKKPKIFSSHERLALIEEMDDELMGIPPEERAVFRHHLDIMLGGLDPTMDISEEEQTASMMATFEQGNKLAQQHAEKPQDNLIAKLLDGTVDGESLSEMEFVTFFLLLIVGGIETTRTSTSHGMRLLMEHPEQYQMLVDNPELVPDAVEEILRFNPAFIHMRRTAMEDVELNGIQIKKGDKVVLMYDSANHDETVFGDDSEIFDITRAQRMPELRNEHRTFGIGQHFCLGSHLARKEMYIVFEEIVKRIRNPKFVTQPHFAQSNFISGIHTMNISFDIAS